MTPLLAPMSISGRKALIQRGLRVNLGTNGGESSILKLCLPPLCLEKSFSFNEFRRNRGWCRWWCRGVEWLGAFGRRR